MKPGTRHINSLRLKDETFTNPRESSGLERAKILELAASIAWQGLLTPLLINETGLIIAGQRRYLAIKALIEWFDAQNYGSPEHDLDALLREQIPSTPVAVTTRWKKCAAELRGRVPVRIVDADADLEGIALADNLQREGMSSYEVAARLAHLHEQGATGANLSRRTGMSKSWVSRKLSAWSGAGAALREAWKGGLPDDAVRELAELAPAEQERRLALGARAVRGPANRPGIDTLKAVLADLEPRWDRGSEYDACYGEAARDVLRWVTGQPASARLLSIINTQLSD